MMMNTTLDQLRSLKLLGMAAGLQDQLTSAGMTTMSFEERTALLVEREVHWRGDKRRERLLKEARLKYPQAAIEDMDGRAGQVVVGSGSVLMPTIIGCVALLIERRRLAG